LNPIKILEFFSRKEFNMKKYAEVKLYSDGGSSFNPGIAAIGVIIASPSDDILYEFSQDIGSETNNQADYIALIKGLELCKQFTQGKVQSFMDMELAVKQLNGIYRVRSHS
jgi:ribonuclease HI